MRGLLAVLLLGACSVRGLDITRTGDGGREDARRTVSDVDGGPSEVITDGPRPDVIVTDGCVPHPEECNGRDDNCNGLIDEDFDLNTNPDHCGTCATACQYANATPLCSIGRCHLGPCQTGFVDVDKTEPNGCECQRSNGGVEICDNQDNDCNGKVDDGFDVQTDPANCGGCGIKCLYPHAKPTCGAGVCAMGPCDPGFLDLDGNPRNGCEYPCAPSNGGVEICDGKDNNCDGTVDEHDDREGQRCWPEGVVGCDVASGVCRAPCAFGTWACLPGGLVCQKAALPGPDVCDGLDNNCDGVVDDGIDLNSDPRNCGACNRACVVANAVPGCSAGACVIKSCRTGFVDLDGRADNGCEYACTPDGPEVCDGKDNDCNGRVDTADPGLLFPVVNFCNQTGECAKGPGGSSRWTEATYPVCSQPAGAAHPDWICNYPASVQLFAPNQVLGDETFCDGLDNDCDGLVDEHARVGTSCQDNSLGECRRTGVLRCQADRTLAATCDTTNSASPTPTDEVCDGKDNDCDGLIDESWDNPPGLARCPGGDCRGVRDDVIHVNAGGGDFFIYRYEASRVDASAADQGVADARSCSRLPGAAGLRPWTLVNLAQARTACAGAGMRLCKVTRGLTCSSATPLTDEWGTACAAGLTCPAGPRAFPYSCDYAPDLCNGADHSADVVATGALGMCLTGDLDAATAGVQGAADMSGNVAEWTDDCRGTLNDGSGRHAYTLRGGSFTSSAQALRCDFMSLVVAETFTFNDTGFRCCSSCAPPAADCNGTCIALATDSQNCGTCGKACAAGQTCANGFCR